MQRDLHFTYCHIKSTRSFRGNLAVKTQREMQHILVKLKDAMPNKLRSITQYLKSLRNLKFAMRSFGFDVIWCQTK